MRGRLFSLVYEDDENDVYGWGVELIGVDKPRAVVILADDHRGHVSFGMHDSAEGALRRWSTWADLELKWLS
jgi:hypothetical protein